MSPRPSSASPVRSPGPSRRALLALGAGLTGAVTLVAAGCSVENPFSDQTTPAAEAVRDLSPDVAVAVEATTLIRGVQAAVGATTTAFPATAPALSGLAAMHAAHLAAVEDAVPDRVDTSAGGAAYQVPATRAAARTRLLAAERTHHDQLVGLAMRAESGPFAGLLGQMAASVSQHLAALDGTAR